MLSHGEVVQLFWLSTQFSILFKLINKEQIKLFVTKIIMLCNCKKIIFQTVESSLPHQFLSIRGRQDENEYHTQDLCCLCKAKISTTYETCLICVCVGTGVFNLFYWSPGGDKAKMSTTHETYPICASTDDERKAWVLVIRRIMFSQIGGGKVQTWFTLFQQKVANCWKICLNFNI